ncbi:sucrose nonfermenting 4-like protein isoform X2 [Henckelia pumila]|uniref:sucrose nonfermenting 4-like protein isoform X2 n=1 Tax=Henckelia pumila TaxID=405737 RepID=UPI003C6E39F1
MDYAHESGMVLIPTRFVWPYGGRDVYISGSFTGWTPWPMTPVEGCPTVFQTICSLPQGYHQYKFVVDGEWRHDEHQPFISSNIGTVNTILLNRESDYHPALLSPQMPHSGNVSSMDVDNEALRRMIRSSDDVSNGPLPTMSDADLEISQHRIAVFLSTHMAYELLPESGKVVALDVDLPVKQAFHILHEQLGSHGSNPTEEELETHTISAWKEAKSYMNNRIDGQGGAVSGQLVHAGPDDSLKEVALKILQNGVATVPIIHSPSEDASNQHLLYLASLSGILKCICRFFKNSTSLLPVLQLPICAIPVGTWLPKIGEPKGRPLALLRPSASLSTALNLLIQAQVSSIPIVDDNDSLLDIYSRSDITSLTKDKLYTHINLEETTIHQALQYRDDPFSTYGYTSQKCHMCLRSDPLYKVMERLSKPEVRRIVIVEAGSKRVEGIISLSDVFRFLLGT